MHYCCKLEVNLLTNLILHSISVCAYKISKEELSNHILPIYNKCESLPESFATDGRAITPLSPLRPRPLADQRSRRSRTCGRAGRLVVAVLLVRIPAYAAPAPEGGLRIAARPPPATERNCQVKLRNPICVTAPKLNRGVCPTDLCFMPTSQDLEQADHSDHSVQPPCRVQLATSRGRPSHSAPPLAGEGESQARFRHSHVEESSSSS